MHLRRYRLATATFLIVSATLASAQPILSRTADIDGVKLHYFTAGHGPAVVLLHGYAETSLMWRPLIPVLADRFTVIAPDLPRHRRLRHPLRTAST